MKTKLCLVALLLQFIIVSSNSAQELWADSEGRFGALFPEQPTRIGAASAGGQGYAYQSGASFTNGGALFAITVVSVPNGGKDEKRFLEELNRGFVMSMGQEPKNAQIKWRVFGDGRPQLNYQFGFHYNGVPFKGRGFWIIDKGQAIRVSVSYTGDLTPAEMSKVIHFLNSFVVLSKQ